ncbi:hypothetical protein [Plantactinospora sp. DSM 117369]
MTVLSDDRSGLVGVGPAEFVQELLFHGSPHLVVGAAPQIALQGDEFPVQDSLPVPTAARFVAVVVISRSKSECLKWRPVAAIEQVELRHGASSRERAVGVDVTTPRDIFMGGDTWLALADAPQARHRLRRTSLAQQGDSIQGRSSRQTAAPQLSF